MTRPARYRRVGAWAFLVLAVVGCGSDEAEEPEVEASPLVDEFLVVLRASTDTTKMAEFDAAQPCLRETFAEYADADLQSMIDGIRAQDLTTVSDELRQRLQDDALSCNEENRALDGADYKADAEQRIADDGVTSVQCDLPTDVSVGTTFRCTGNFQNRTSEYQATIDAVGHVVIVRTD
jgi:hypothetical protein